jgi:nucleolin
MEPGDRRFAKPEGKGEEESELFCGSLSWDASEDDIYNLFAEYGEVKNVKLLKDYEGRSRGRAFVLFADPTEAAAALAMNG